MISSFHRRLYTSLVDQGQYDFQDSPFSSQKNSFYHLLTVNNLINNNLIETEKSTKDNLININKNLIILQNIMKIIYKILGPNKYILLVKFFRPFSRFENHTFILNNKTKGYLK